MRIPFYFLFAILVAFVFLRFGGEHGQKAVGIKDQSLFPSKAATSRERIRQCLKRCERYKNLMEKFFENGYLREKFNSARMNEIRDFAFECRAALLAANNLRAAEKKIAIDCTCRLALEAVKAKSALKSGDTRRIRVRFGSLEKEIEKLGIYLKNLSEY